MLDILHIFNNLYRLMAATYLAQVVNVNSNSKGVEVAFVYYGSITGNIHFDEIRPTSQRYEQAKKLKVGDEVYAAPSESDRIFHFKLHTPAKRLFVRTLKPLWLKMKGFY